MAKIGAIFHGRIHLYKDDAIVNDPTIAEGDVVVCKADGTVANIATLPTANENDTDFVEYELSAAETAGDPGESATIKWEDQVESGNDWEPLCIDIPLDTYSLADLPQAVWDVLTSALTTVGSIGKLLVDRIDAAISGRSTFDPASDEVDVGEVKGVAVAGVDDFKADVSALATSAQVQAECEDALEAYDLDHFIQVTAGSEEPTDGSYLDQIMHKSSSQGYSAATDSLEAIRDKIATANITVNNVLGADGAVEVYENLDYYDADGKALEWTDSDSDWPDLTGATVTLHVKGVGTVTCSVTTPTGPATVKVEVSSSTLSNHVGNHEYQVRAVLSSGHTVDLVTDTFTINAAV